MELIESHRHRVWLPIPLFATRLEPALIGKLTLRVQ